MITCTWSDAYSVPASNWGCHTDQSDGIGVLDGYQYYHESTITLIDHWEIGDMALCKINVPIPANYDVFYSGWITDLHTLNSGDFNGWYSPFVDIHHASGDIKKISSFGMVSSMNNQINVGCTIITTIIDVLLNWFLGIWGQQISTETICNYVDIPFYFAPGATVGTLEAGSSGSPLFTKYGAVIGVHAASCSQSDPAPKEFSPCDHIQNNHCATLNDFWWSKFKNFYRYSYVKNALNPNHDSNVNQFGLGGRKHYCYDNLDLNGQYFPLSDYQSNNHLELHANNNINVNGALHIHAGSDYTFSAGDDITLGSDFTVDNSSDFTARPGDASNNCNPNFYREAQPHTMYDDLRAIVASLPIKKKFDILEHINPLKIYPNPSSGIFTVSVLYDKDFTVQIFDVLGKIVYQNSGNSNEQLTEQKFSVDLTILPSGFYICKVVASDGQSWNSRISKAN